MGSLLNFHLVKTISRTEIDKNTLGHTAHVFFGLWGHQGHLGGHTKYFQILNYNGPQM